MRVQYNSDPGPVAGYAWPQSVVPGEDFGLHLTNRLADPAVAVEVARIGARRELVWRGEFNVADHPYPDGFTSHGCDWPAVAVVTAGDNWRSGFYEILMRGAEGPESRAFVVVRAVVGSEADILLPLSTNTWNAYNDVHNGLCLYTGANVASFQRPMSPGFLHKPQSFAMRTIPEQAGDPLRTAFTGYKLIHGFSDWCGGGGWANWEHQFTVWAERQGYRIDYAVSADLERGSKFLAPYKLVVSVGHDEYWSGPMRDAVESYVEAGGNAVFFSGNTSFWQVRIEEHGTKMAGYKYDFRVDPVYGTDRETELTSIWSDRLVGRPENEMTGVSFCRGGYARMSTCVPSGSGGYTVQRADHWLLEGTDLEYGDLLGAESVIVAYEADGCDFSYRDGLPYPTGTDGTPINFEIVATSPVTPLDRGRLPRPIPDDQPSEIEFVAERSLGDASLATQAKIAHGHAVMGTFSRGDGTVVTVGCTEWVHGLSGRSPQVEQITHNVFARLADSQPRRPLGSP